MPNKQETTDLKIPNHIAIIPDGNRRWAKSKGLPTLMGHRTGFEAANKDIEYARDIGVHTMTLWGFSTENWNRTEEEVKYLMNLFEEMIEKNLKKAIKQEARIIHLGRKDRIPEALRKKIENAEEKTLNFTKHTLNMAIDYGGHDEITRATQKILRDFKDGKITSDDLYKEDGKYAGKYPYLIFKNYLDTKDQPYPYPDLLIRTSGEQRFSGFLSWQMAYSEIYFAKVHMPDFGPKEFKKAIEDYSRRDRRFGGNSKLSTGDYTKQAN
ncbi:di-trans,poly-cis-decaprenylcistransferase [Patescibacteria group bacterium]|nr:di-trans,poly-cis-decaprenylcistransferase [Patescibacteria group bacterium]